MKLGDFLNTQASKLGLQQDQRFVAFVQANPQLANIEFDDAIAVPINSGHLKAQKTTPTSKSITTHWH